MCRRIKPKDRLILKAVVCCLYRDRTISGKVDGVISCRVKLYRFLCPDGLPMLYIQDSGLWILWQHIWYNRINHGSFGWW
jgi:hypothetical protein